MFNNLKVLVKTFDGPKVIEKFFKKLTPTGPLNIFRIISIFNNLKFLEKLSKN